MAKDKHDERRRDESTEPQEGQVSEAAKPDGEVGGADATDKSTGTAPQRADQPDS